MTRYNFIFTGIKVSETAEFADASLNELRVIQVLYDLGGSADEDTLISRSGISKARLVSCLTFWQEAGVIAPSEERSLYGNKVIEEFPDRIIPGEQIEESAIEIAQTIRSHKLASLFDEIAAMIGKVMLTPMEMKNIAALSSQYKLSEEYIATLAAHLHGKDRLTVRNLTSKAKKLSDGGVCTVEDLERAISDEEKRRTDLIEYRRALGVHDRQFSPKECEYVDKWSNTYSFGVEIVTLAYGFCTVKTGHRRFDYIDKLLTDWWETGCKTLDDCQKRYEAVEIIRENEAKEKKKTQASYSPKPKKDAPRYGDFDPEEAFRLAVARSYPAEKSGENN